jgi:hypothetical protein
MRLRRADDDPAPRFTTFDGDGRYAGYFSECTSPERNVPVFAMLYAGAFGLELATLIVVAGGYPQYSNECTQRSTENCHFIAAYLHEP